jgi:nucleotide-binding universal stress UspA family protein
LYYAFGLARRQGGALIAAFVFTSGVAYDGTPFGTYELDVKLARELKLAIESLANEYQVEAHFVCGKGDPVTALGQIATDHRADAIVLGASRAFIHRLFGSNALSAVRRSRHPITVVP